jgi:hypothetical protein
MRSSSRFHTVWYLMMMIVPEHGVECSEHTAQRLQYHWLSNSVTCCIFRLGLMSCYHHVVTALYLLTLGWCSANRTRNRHEGISYTSTICGFVPLQLFNSITGSFPRVEASKNTSTVMPASRKRRRKGNRNSLRLDSASRPNRRLYFSILLNCIVPWVLLKNIKEKTPYTPEDGHIGRNM